jgi:hypothetical protein
MAVDWNAAVNLQVVSVPRTYSYVGRNQTEDIFCLSEDGKLELVSRISKVASGDETFYGIQPNSEFHEAILKKYLWKHWDRIEDYVKSNGLKLKRKNDLLKVFDFYFDLEN